MQSATVAAIRELENGWIALAGMTGSGGAWMLSGDSDGMLLVTDPGGEGIAQFRGCLADAQEIEAMLENKL